MARNVRWMVGRGTTRRFVLLIVLLVLACVALVTPTVLALRADAAFPRCARAGDVALDDDPATVWLRLTGSAEYVACTADEVSLALWCGLVATAVVVLAAVLTGWALPAWRTRGGRLPAVSPAAPTPVPDLLGTWPPSGLPPFAVPRRGPVELPARLAELVERSGLPRHRVPEFVINPSASAASAVAFGRPGRSVVCLNAGLVKLRSKRPEVFDAVVTHELAHVRNRDVGLAWFTFLFWRFFAALVLVPFVAVQGWLLLESELLGAERDFWPEAAPGVGDTLIGVALAAGVALVRSATLRQRELVADLDAVALGAEPRVWAERADAQPRPDSRRAAVARALRELGRPHPPWEERAGILSTGPVWYGGGGCGAVVLYLVAALTTAHLLLTRLDPIAFTGAWRALFYLVVPPMVATGSAVLPEKHPERLAPVERSDDAGPPTATTGRRLGVIVLLVGALLVVDPVGRAFGPASPGGLDPPPPYVLPEAGPLSGPEAVAAFVDAGGRTVLTRLSSELAVDLGEFRGLRPDDDAGLAELDRHCVATAAAVAVAERLPDFPGESAAELWSTHLTLIADTRAALCELTPGRELDSGLPIAGLLYTAARENLRFLDQALTLDELRTGSE
ncbi:M48 family metalloprotease [Streptomyces sp. DSM 44915]|uniref:M48 family metalloprotease n=1 Tax=Streptomyces chisholmiae TaxID=3075540 RepID=A0ABU2JQY3_9ACTN|nr:M48 family metalloprotease [Streptomyces sp. DSM 44915]MDT0267385.1 M48 family metalloprotease [Streptomyces sp. DSM 44915]